MKEKDCGEDEREGDGEGDVREREREEEVEGELVWIRKGYRRGIRVVGDGISCTKMRKKKHKYKYK